MRPSRQPVVLDPEFAIDGCRGEPWPGLKPHRMLEKAVPIFIHIDRPQEDAYVCPHVANNLTVGCMTQERKTPDWCLLEAP